MRSDAGWWVDFETERMRKAATRGIKEVAETRGIKGVAETRNATPDKHQAGKRADSLQKPAISANCTAACKRAQTRAIAAGDGEARTVLSGLAGYHLRLRL